MKENLKLFADKPVELVRRTNVKIYADFRNGFTLILSVMIRSLSVIIVSLVLRASDTVPIEE